MLFARISTLFSVLMVCFILAGCAYSDVERTVTSNVDIGVEKTRQKVNATSESSVADSYQNASQSAKGVFLGGAAGGLTGAFLSSIGVIPGALVGSVFGASYGAYIDSKATLADRLQNRGVVIVILGDHILIVIPSARIFEDMSSKIKPDAYSTLNLVTCFINGYTKMLVKIATYTNPMQSSELAACLSTEQAESLSRYFVASGLDARVLYAVGYGGMNPVQRSSYAWKENDNYRIEIMLEKEYGC